MKMRYIALLRGVNVGGKNKVPMAELRRAFEDAGHENVRTCLNSGNVAFSCDGSVDAAQIEAMLAARFGFDVPVYVTVAEALSDLLSRAPDWWGAADRAVYDNLIFILPPTTCAEVLHALGEPKEGLERIQPCGGAIFWSFSRKDYQKTNWWPRTAADPIGARLTIRTAGTVRKIAGL